MSKKRKRESSKTKVVDAAEEDSMDSKGEVVYFYGHTKGSNHGEFSQFFPSKFTGPDATVYPFAEMWMMTQKAKLMGDSKSASEMLAARSPGRVKALGRKVHPWNQKKWDAHKYTIVLEGTRLKFSQSKRLRRVLLGTGDAVLAEAAPSDRVWGIGLGVLEAQQGQVWRGQNLLGKALMQVREELRKAEAEVAGG